MALGGVVLSAHVPARTCVGCRQVDAQSALVRLAYDRGKLVIDRSSAPLRGAAQPGNAGAFDRQRRVPGRGAYVHPRASCLAAIGTSGRGGLARSLRRKIPNEDLRRIVNEMSPTVDNSAKGEENAVDLSPGKGPADTVETPPRTKAENDRSEDARL